MLLKSAATVTEPLALIPPAVQRAGDISEGHALVYRICTESGQPKDAQQQCYQLFIDYVRAVFRKYGDTLEFDAVVLGLKKAFKYLDQHYTNTKPRNTPRDRKPTTQLCSGQDLDFVVSSIVADVHWVPDYHSEFPTHTSLSPSLPHSSSSVSRD